MSRPPPSKSRGEKTGSRGAVGAQSVAAAAVPVSNEIVPGRLTEAEWLKLIAEDEDSSFLGSVVDDIVEKTLEKCYEKYVWNQLIPYTVDFARNSILQIVDWHFLSRDVGEKDIAEDVGWKEDSEPEAGVIDSWAQGSVPVVVRPQSSLAPSVSAISESVQEKQDKNIYGAFLEPFNQAMIERKHMQQKNEKTIVAKQPDTLREFFRPRDPNGKFTQTLELNITKKRDAELEDLELKNREEKEDSDEMKPGIDKHELVIEPDVSIKRKPSFRLKGPVIKIGKKVDPKTRYFGVRERNELVEGQEPLRRKVQKPKIWVREPPPHPVEDSIGYESEPATTVVDQPAEPDVSDEDQAAAAKIAKELKLEAAGMQKKESKPTKSLDRKASKSNKTKPSQSVDAFTHETEYEKKRKRRIYKKHTGRLPPLPSTDFDTLDGPKPEEGKTEEEGEKPGMHLSPSQKSLIKSQAGRPPGNREVTFDEKGNVVGVMKLNVHTLPTHKVRVQYTVIDPLETGQKTGIRFLRNQRDNFKKVEKSSAVTKSMESKTVNTTKSTTSKYKSETASSYKTRDLAVTVQQFPPGMESLIRNRKSSKATVREKNVRGARIDPLPPLLIEAIEASPGVVIQEGDHVKKGPEEAYPNNMTRALSKSTTIEHGPKLRLVGDRLFQTKLRPVFDPSDVVEVDKSKQTIFSVTTGLQPRTFEQPAES